MRDTNVQNIGNGNVNIKSNTISKNSKVTISIGIIAIIGIIIFLFSSNSKTGIEKDIIAKWQNREEKDIYFIFTEENIVTLQDGDIYIDGTYLFVKENEIQINLTYSGINFSLSGDVNIQHDILTLSNIVEPQGILGADSMTLTFDLVR